MLGEMNPRLRAFCEAYATHGNGSRAVVEAGYDPKTADKAFTRLIRRPEVKEAVELLGRRLMLTVEVEADDVVRELAAVAFASPKDVMRWGHREDGTVFLDVFDSDDLTPEQAAAVKAVKIKRRKRTGAKGWESEEIEVVMHDKAQALDKLARHFAIYRDVNVSIDARTQVVNAAAGMSTDELREYIAGLRELSGRPAVIDASPHAEG